VSVSSRFIGYWWTLPVVENFMGGSAAAEAPTTAMPHSTHRHSAAHKIRFHRGGIF